MKLIFPAAPIALTFEERQALEALPASRKSEAQMRDRTRIVLLAVAGLVSRAIGREVAAHPARSPNGGPLRA
jgi:hypothetical protein